MEPDRWALERALVCALNFRYTHMKRFALSLTPIVVLIVVGICLPVVLLAEHPLLDRVRLSPSRDTLIAELPMGGIEVRRNGGFY